MSNSAGDPFPYPQWQPPFVMPPMYMPLPEPQMTLRDKLAAACLPAIYANMTQLTDRAAELAYEQADEMLKARDDAAGDESK